MARGKVFAGTEGAARAWSGTIPVHEADRAACLAMRADLVVAAATEHELGSRLLLVNTDWELIRACPCRCCW